LIKKLFSHTLIYALGPQVPRIASLFVLPIITKDLTATDYGVAGVIMAYTGLLGGFKDLGFAVNMSNVFYRHPARWLLSWRQLHGYLSFWTLPYTFFQALLLYFVIPQEAVDNRFVIIGLYSFTSIFFDTTITVGSRYYQLAQRPFYMAMTSAIVGSLTIGFNLITISYFKMGYMGWFVSTFLGSGISFLFYFFPMYFKYRLVPIFKLRRKFIVHQLKISLPIIPHNYSSYLLSTSDRLVMNVLGIKLDKIGIYNIAYTFGNYFDFVGTAVGMAVGPVYTKLYSLKQDKDLRMFTYMLQCFFLFGSFIVSLWLKEIFTLLIKNVQLQAGYFLGIIVIMGYNYRPMYWAVISKLAYYEKTSHLWRISFFAGTLNIILNFIFIPIYGYQAAAVTTFVGLLYIGFSGFFLKAYKDLQNQNYYPLAWLAAIVGLTILVYLLKDIAISFKILITIFVSFAGLLTFLKYKALLQEINL
jgi:O-antigen/teichoic acid export membrane protein